MRGGLKDDGAAAAGVAAGATAGFGCCDAGGCCAVGGTCCAAGGAACCVFVRPGMASSATLPCLLTPAAGAVPPCCSASLRWLSSGAATGATSSTLAASGAAPAEASAGFSRLTAATEMRASPAGGSPGAAAAWRAAAGNATGRAAPPAVPLGSLALPPLLPPAALLTSSGSRSLQQGRCRPSCFSSAATQAARSAAACLLLGSSCSADSQSSTAPSSWPSCRRAVALQHGREGGARVWGRWSGSTVWQ